MALIGKIEKRVGRDGKEVEDFSAQFTNGTVSQLRDLANFLKKEGFDLPEEENEMLTEVIKVGISWLVSQREKSKSGSKE